MPSYQVKENTDRLVVMLSGALTPMVVSEILSTRYTPPNDENVAIATHWPVYLLVARFGLSTVESAFKDFQLMESRTFSRALANAQSTGDLTGCHGLMIQDAASRKRTEALLDAVRELVGTSGTHKGWIDELTEFGWAGEFAKRGWTLPNVSLPEVEDAKTEEKEHPIFNVIGGALQDWSEEMHSRKRKMDEKEAVKSESEAKKVHPDA